ncbi:MAG: ferrous iron transport protein B [Veillonellaceae bacterium]|nr:ferrous iron transport protein B [Veillonellaceae bacterium]
MSTACVTVALAGNPNSGKTTIFNNITGARQHVGNYPGVTVERREGFRRFQGQDMVVIDLPGTYSLTANSMDEVVARNVIIDEQPDLIVNILDAANLERNLYLAVQLLELERPMVLALNMTDVAEQAGIMLDEKALQRRFDIPVVGLVGNRNQGTDKLLQAVIDASARHEYKSFAINYGTKIEAAIHQTIESLTGIDGLKYPLRWLAIKLLENDADIRRTIGEMPVGTSVLAAVDASRNKTMVMIGEDLEIAIAEKRYQYVGEVYRGFVDSHAQVAESRSDRIDRLLTHRVLGLPIFFGIMWVLFNVVFKVGEIPQGWLEEGVKWFGTTVAANMAEGELRSLVVDGMIGGVGSVITFLPSILLLFFGIALLEDTGYMARAAFVMDRVMRAVGLHGKSFIPLLLGFGCSVPAVMGTRTLENRGDRMVTILVAPLMSCSARLPVYTLMIAAFFPERMAGSVLFGVYLLGIVLAILMSLIFRKWLFDGTTEPFIMEMPAYHLPTLRSIMLHMWERSVLYLKKAGTLILTASILIWFLTNYPAEVQYAKDYEAAKANITERYDAEFAKPLLGQIEKEQAAEKIGLSYAGRFGKAIEPIIKPLGFDWKMGVGLVSAVAAKEVLVSTLATIYSVGDVEEDSQPLQQTLAADPTFSPLVALSLMVFTLLYSPCLSVLAVIRRETNSWKWPAFSFVYSTVLAWVMAFVVYQGGLLLQLWSAGMR